MTATEMTLEEYLTHQSKHKPRAQPEYEAQVGVFQWAEENEAEYPDLKYLFSTLNGVRTSPGIAAKAKKAGNKRGVPDIWLCAKRGPYAGLVIELKHGENRPSPEQKLWIAYLNSQGFYACVCWGTGEATRTIINYLEGRI